jgi:hypothetical protein
LGIDKNKRVYKIARCAAQNSDVLVTPHFPSHFNKLTKPLQSIWRLDETGRFAHSRFPILT